MPNDVEVVFLGDSKEAQDAASDLDKALATLKAIAEGVTKALADIEIAPSTVTKFVSEAKVMERSLEDIEDQANDTRRALAQMGLPLVGGAALAGRQDLGPLNMIAAFARNQVYDPAYRQRFASPITGVQSNIPPPPPPLVNGIPAYDLRDPNYSAAAMAAILASRRDPYRGLGSAGTLAALGWGTGGIGIPYIGRFGMGRLGVPGAGIGTAFGLAGFGAERLIASTLGITGSVLGGVLGGGLYGLGLAGTMGVGMATDAAGIGQAAGDIKTVNKDLNSLNQAIALYGRNSLQAKQAQAQLNYDLGQFSPIARNAVLHAAQASQTFKTLFDKFTGPAEKTGANIITQGIQTGQPFLPVLGRYAAENMKIIQTGLQPLFSWADSQKGGLGIFTQLEQIFQNRLPTAVHAGVQAFEIFAHIILDAAKQTGDFLTKIDAFLTRTNTPKGLEAVQDHVDNLIGLFKTWAKLLFDVGHLIFDLFFPAVGLGKAFAQQLDDVVNITRKWLEAKGTRDVLHALFDAHKQQLIEIFNIIKPMIPVFLQVVSAFLQIETVVTRLTIGPLKVLADLLKVITSNPLANKILGWAIAFLVVEKANRAFYDMLGLTLGRIPLIGTLLERVVGIWGTAITRMLGFVKNLIVEGFTRLLTAMGLIGPAAETQAVVVDEAMAAEAAAVNTTTTSVGGLRAALLSLSGSAVLGGLATLAAAIGAAYAGYKTLQFGLKGITNSFNVGPGGTMGPGPPTAGAPIDPSNWSTWTADEQSAWIMQHTQKGDFNYWMTHPAERRKFLESHYHAANASRSAQPVGGGGHAPGAGHHRPPGGGGVTGPHHHGHHRDPTGGGAGSGSGDSSGYSPGGTVSQAQGEGLWIAAGGPRSVAKVMGAVMMAESGGRIDAVGGPNSNGTYDYGLWQINSSHGYNKQKLLSDPSYNAKAAVSIYHSQGLGAWTTYTSGAYLSYMGNAAPPAVPPGSRAPATAGSNYKPFKYKPQHFTPFGQQPAGQSYITQDVTAAQQALTQIQAATHESFAKLAGANPPKDPLKMHPFAVAIAHFDPLLREWKKQLKQLEDELHKHGLTNAMEQEIRARIDRIKNHVTAAFSAIRAAAQQQFQLASQAWQAFTSQFDTNFANLQSANPNNNALITQLQTQLGQWQQAVNIDTAQSAVLGGTADTSMAQQIINALTASIGAVTATVNGQQLPYTQQQIDNWLQIWGNYYAALGYTPEQMYNAFNALLQSVGLPTIDNPFDTGSLPLPPGYGGSSAPPPPGGSGDPGVPYGPGYHPGPSGAMPRVGSAYRITVPAAAARVVAAVASPAQVTPAPATVHVSFANGMDWLGDFVTVAVNNQIVQMGRSASVRARSGRH